MPHPDVTQLVSFRTALDLDRFVTGWRPVAAGFLAQGLRTITLASLADVGAHGDGTRFLSRNTWPADAYARSFPAGLAADASAGPVSAVQAGAYAVLDGEPVATARPDLDLVLALVRLDDPEDAGEARAALLEGVAGSPDAASVAYAAAGPARRYDLALTVHGPAGSGEALAAALLAAAAPLRGQGRVLVGREVLSLPGPPGSDAGPVPR